MKMMKNKFMTVIMALIMIFFMSGCTLAVDGAGSEGATTQDQMIGVFITTKYLPLTDSNRIYATIDKHGSTEASDWDIYFEGTDGINFFVGRWPSIDGKFNYTMLTSDSEICDSNTHYSTTDEGNFTELTGTLYASPAMSDCTCYVNPVCQTPAGDIYAVAGTGYLVRSVTGGAQFTANLSSQAKLTKDGISEITGTSVQITLKGAYEPTEIFVHQMDNNNVVVKTEKYAPGALPNVIKAEIETAYIIVETKINNPEIPDDSTRELYYHKDEKPYFETFLITESGWLGKMSTRIEW